MARQDVVVSVRTLGYPLSLSELAAYERWNVALVPCVPQLAIALDVSETWLMTGEPISQGPDPVRMPELDGQLLEHWRALDPKAKGIIVRMAAALAKVDVADP